MCEQTKCYLAWNYYIYFFNFQISLLRLELKRKDAALEAERLDRCTALEAAEKRGREKVRWELTLLRKFALCNQLQ